MFADPTGPLADDALFALGGSYFARGLYYDAASYYEQMITEYPQSDLLEKSYLLGIQSQLRSYQGPNLRHQAN